MLYKYEKQGNKFSLTAMPFYDYADIGGKEKDLENLLAQNLGELYVENGQLMPIFQERQWQPEPDLLALDKTGNLIIFELKRSIVRGDTTIQIMRYTQEYGRKVYSELDRLYRDYKNTNKSLSEDHQSVFGLDKPLSEGDFNKKQKLVIVGSSSDETLIDAVTYWKNSGLDIDFLPYRLYKIKDEIYFEFFAKPFDYHVNTRDAKGILFDTNKSYDKNSVWEMFAGSKISAYGSTADDVKRFQQGDFVFYYHAGKGVIGAGIITSQHTVEIKANEEKYRDVKLLTPVLAMSSNICAISSSELYNLLGGKTFYWATTAKTPYLSVIDSKIIVDELRLRYNLPPIYNITAVKELVKSTFDALLKEMEQIASTYDLKKITPRMRGSDKEKWGDYTLCVEQYASRKVNPGIYYKCNSLSLEIDNLELWFGIEIEECLYAGFMVYNPDEDNCVTKRSPALDTKLTQILKPQNDKLENGVMPVWTYLHTSSSAEKINFRNMNDEAVNLYDKNIFQKSISKMSEQIKDMLRP